VIFHCWSRQLHEVIHQRIAPPAIGMQEATRQIESSDRERLTGLAIEIRGA
jgi:hypothetical protein